MNPRKGVLGRTAGDPGLEVNRLVERARSLARDGAYRDERAFDNAHARYSDERLRAEIEECRRGFAAVWDAGRAKTGPHPGSWILVRGEVNDDQRKLATHAGALANLLLRRGAPEEPLASSSRAAGIARAPGETPSPPYRWASSSRRACVASATLLALATAGVGGYALGRASR